MGRCKVRTTVTSLGLPLVLSNAFWAMILCASAATAQTADSRRAIVPNDGSYTFTHGPYVYDPSGNIAGIGSDYFVYDATGRLIKEGINRPDQPGTQQRIYEYDVYGNRTKAGADQYPVIASSNRLTGVTYDEAGNLTAWHPAGSGFNRVYTYDALNMVKTETAGDRSAIHIYTPSDERLRTVESIPGSSATTSHWTLRNLDGKVLRDFVDDGTTAGDAWQLHREYFYRNGQLLAAITPARTEHYTVDHLGTPRLITGDNITPGPEVRSEHYYFAFGEEWTIPGQAVNGGTLKFTGHERDDDLLGQPRGTLDYMHARYYSANLGRFLSVDPHGFWDLQSGSEDDQRAFRRYIAEPQRWNRYAYVQNNPLRYIDPDGRESRAAIAFEHDIRDLSAGRITQEEYFDRTQARGVGAGIGVATVLGGVGGFRLATGLAVRFGLMGASLSGAGGAGMLKAIEQVNRTDGRIFQAATNFARGTANNFASNLTALARAVTQVVGPQGRITQIGTVNGQAVWGSARTGLGIVDVKGVTKVVQMLDDGKYRIVGNFR